MNINLTHLQIIYDALVTSRLVVTRDHTARRPLRPAVQHKLNEMLRLISYLDANIIDSRTGDTWTIEKN